MTGPFVASQQNGFILFSPDSIVSGTYSDALAYLDGMGIKLHGYKWTSVSLSQVSGLYGANRAATDSAEDVLVDRLFTSGPSLACWVTAPQLTGPPLVGTIRVLKGHKDPAQCQPGHLRHLLGAENTVMNSMHSSDSIAHAVDEIGVLGISTFEPADKAPEKDVHAPLGTASALGVVARIFGDAVHSIPGGVSAEYRTRQDAAEHLARLPVKPVGVLTQLQRIWGEQARLAGDGVEADALRRVASICSAAFDADAVADAIGPLGLVLSDWEDLVLRCQALRGPLPQWN